MKTLIVFLTCLYPLASQTTICRTVTADQLGSSGINTTAIQTALDSCTAGQVELSAARGNSFTSGALFIPSNVTLLLDPTVTLNASTDPADFQRTTTSRTLACDSSTPIATCGTLSDTANGCLALLNSCKTNGSGVAGTGTIEGHGWSALSGGPNKGSTWWDLATAAKAGNYATSLNAPKIIAFQQVTSAALTGFTIDNAPLVHMLLSKASNATVTQVTIVTPTPDRRSSSYPYNSDGLDISGSTNIQVDGVDFYDGDDNIAMEAGGNGPVANISITNSIFRAGHGLSIGSPTSSGAMDITATGLRFQGTDNGLRIKTDQSRGGIVDRIRYSNVCMAGVKNPIVIDPYYSSATGTLLPRFRNVEIDNLYADSGDITLRGFAGQPALNLILNNVRLDSPGKVLASNANINEISDPGFPFPINIPLTPGVTVTQTSAAAQAPVDIKQYCQSSNTGAPAPTATTSTLIDDKFAQGNSQLQDLANNSLWLFNGRSNNIRTDAPGSVTFDVTPAGTSSEGFWAYFTPPGAPVVLGVGDKLSVSTTFSLTGFKPNGQDIRFGILDSLSTRNTANLTGGMNDATFINDPGYGLQFYGSATGNPFVIGRRTVLSNANVFNNFGDFATINGTGASDRQPLTDGASYTLTYSIERIGPTGTRLTGSIAGGALTGLTYSALEESATPATSFDYFAFRIGGTNFTSQISFTELKVQYIPAPPVITSEAQPSSLTVQVGSKVSIAIGVIGNALTYAWQKDGKPLTGNDSANTPTLNLSNTQLSDAGTYTLLITNAGGTITSKPVTLNVSTQPVAPSPAITSQPANAIAKVGGTTSFIVRASGQNLSYQWFKNGALLPGANLSTLSFTNAQIPDSASYFVSIGNSSGTIASNPASLLVVSAMTAISAGPYPAQTQVCTDSPLTMQFDRNPQVGKTGRIRVYNASGAVVDTIDMAATPQTRLIGGNSFAYYPVMVSGDTATIYLHRPLPLGGTYSITVDAGVLTDLTGAPYGGLNDARVWYFSTPTAVTNPFLVAADGTADFCTVQSAIDAVPEGNQQPVTITVRPGTYTGIVYIPATKPFLTIRGEDRDGTVLQYPNNNNLNPSTVGRPAFGVDAADFTLQDITVWNTTPRGGSQAEAVRGNGQRILLNRVTLKSFQDTLMLQGTGFVNDSYIEGDVDFMWGSGAVYYRNSELKALTSGGYFTQIRNPQNQPGNIYVNCRLTAAPDVTGMYLSRIDPTVYPYSQVMFIDSTMGSHIVPAGWLLNNATAAPAVQFWEYRSTAPNGTLLDISQRAPFSRQMTAQEAAQWSNPAFVLNGWVPKLN